MIANFFLDSMIILRFGDKNSKWKVLCCKKANIWELNFGNIVMLEWVKTKTNSKHLIWYLDKVIRPLDLIMPIISGYVNPNQAVVQNGYPKHILLYKFLVTHSMLMKLGGFS